MGKVITINRQFGSGGREVGKRLSQALSYFYYDKELVYKLSELSGLDPTYIENNCEKYNTASYPYMIGRSFMSYQQPIVQMNIDLQIKQREMILDIAQKEDAVIIGRCADYILKNENVFKVYIYASNMDFRVKRCFDNAPEGENKTEEQMRKQILQIDKQRSKYYNQYTGQKWGDMQNYNLCIDTSKVCIKKAV